MKTSRDKTYWALTTETEEIDLTMVNAQLAHQNQHTQHARVAEAEARKMEMVAKKADSELREERLIQGCNENGSIRRPMPQYQRDREVSNNKHPTPSRCPLKKDYIV